MYQTIMDEDMKIPSQWLYTVIYNGNQSIGDRRKSSITTTSKLHRNQMFHSKNKSAIRPG